MKFELTRPNTVKDEVRCDNFIKAEIFTSTPFKIKKIQNVLYNIAVATNFFPEGRHKKNKKHGKLVIFYDNQISGIWKKNTSFIRSTGCH